MTIPVSGPPGFTVTVTLLTTAPTVAVMTEVQEVCTLCAVTNPVRLTTAQLVVPDDHTTPPAVGEFDLKVANSVSSFVAGEKVVVGVIPV